MIAVLFIFCFFYFRFSFCKIVISCQVVHHFQPYFLSLSARERTAAPLACNVRAAWRRRGVRYCSCGTLTFIFPLHFPRRYTPACAKPQVVGWPLCPSIKVSRVDIWGKVRKSDCFSFCQVTHTLTTIVFLSARNPINK